MPNDLITASAWSSFGEVEAQGRLPVTLRWVSVSAPQGSNARSEWRAPQLHGEGPQPWVARALQLTVSSFVGTVAGVALATGLSVPISYGVFTGGRVAVSSGASTWAVSVSDEHATPLRWVDYVMRRLDALESTEPQLRPSADALARARTQVFELLDDETRSPSVVPVENDGVMFVWHQAGVDLSITFDNDGSFVWARQRGADRLLFSGSLHLNREATRELLRQFTA